MGMDIIRLPETISFPYDRTLPITEALYPWLYAPPPPPRHLLGGSSKGNKDTTPYFDGGELKKTCLGRYLDEKCVLGPT